MDPRWLEHLHGHAGWLSAVALVHPAILLRNPKRRAAWSVGLSTALTTLVFGGGVLIYGPYRAKLKQHIFQTAPSIGLLFERKEHLAFGVLLFAWVGALAYVVARSNPTSALKKLAHRSFLIAAALAIVVAALGTTVAVFQSF